MNKQIHASFQISPFMVLFLIHSVQVGIGILGFQQSLIENAGNDSWIAVIIAGALVHFVIWITYMLLNRAQMDLIEIHKKIFGKFFGNFLSLIWIVYYTLFGMTVIFSYFEIIRVWMFPDISVIWMSIVFLGLVIYTLYGGFRTVAGICFLGVVIPAYLFLTFLFPIPYSDLESLFPIWNHTTLEIFNGVKEMSFSFLGFSTLLFFYPFIKDAKKSQKWAHIGAFITTSTYFFLTVISLGYFSEEQLARQVWATLTLWKIAEMPIAERFEYIGITSWTLIILPNLCLAFWVASRGLKQITGIKQKNTTIIVLVIVLCTSVYFKGRKQVELLGAVTSQIGIFCDFIYIPLLFVLYIIISKWRKTKWKS